MKSGSRACGGLVVRPNRFVSCFYACVVLLVTTVSTAEAQRHGHARVRVAYPVVVGGGFYAPYYPFFWGYYGWWGYPHPAYWGGYPARSSARIQVTPRHTEVYVDGYLAGTVDDFDGFSQRLTLEPGDHVIELYLDGHRTVAHSMYFQPGETYRIRHVMEPLATGEAAPARPAPRVRPPSAAGAAAQSMRPEQRDSGGQAGTLSIRVQPADAVVIVDGERWDPSAPGARLQLHLAPGRHRVEVQKDGYQPFVTTVQVRPGTDTPLNVSLSR
jgi:hypothetical protein